eukprot:4771535-Pyramimonas_sp.AAC.1
MDEYSLRLAKKSTITCSDMRDARRIQKRLQARGISIITAPQISYLGVDLARGKRHGRATRQKRFATTLKQHNKVRRYAFASKRFRVLQKVELVGPLDLRQELGTGIKYMDFLRLR